MRPRTAILIPVKSTARAKGRLGSVLDQTARQQLSLAMLEDVLAAVMPAAGSLVDAVYVATSDPGAMAIARRHGATVLPEKEQRSESHSVDAASRACTARRVEAVLTVPADVPAVRTEDIAALLSAAGGSDHAVVLVPSRDGLGTNAIWRRPPQAIPSRFGFDSFRKHQAEAEGRGLSWVALQVPRLAVDVDEPEDLAAFLEWSGETRTRALLERLGVPGRPERSGDGGLSLVGLPGIPEVAEGDDLARLISEAAERQGSGLAAGDVLVVAQKVVSKAEGRVVWLAGVVPSGLAREFADTWGKDARFVEVVLRESRRIVRMDRGVIIAETSHGFICANAGVDASNVPGEDRVSLLPVDPDASARRLRKDLTERCGAEVAVIVSGTFGRPWREGLTNVAIGVAGLSPLVSYVGRQDPHGHTLRVTELAVADELAAAAGLRMGKLERIPAVRMRGYRFESAEGRARSLVRSAERDLFR
ncbi:MAG: coenzyme F420-0:L-glutamate ligase [candidate division NC10 bacterium]|nr:coenzyme F420-0:L-glutamate ligase [candidate division NC10 bacterium]